MAAWKMLEHDNGRVQVVQPEEFRNVCTVHKDGWTREDQLAVAKLIEAAPQLLALCEEVYHHLHTRQDMDRCKELAGYMLKQINNGAIPK